MLGDGFTSAERASLDRWITSAPDTDSGEDGTCPVCDNWIEDCMCNLDEDDWREDR